MFGRGNEYGFDGSQKKIISPTIQHDASTIAMILNYHSPPSVGLFELPACRYFMPFIESIQHSLLQTGIRKDHQQTAAMI